MRGNLIFHRGRTYSQPAPSRRRITRDINVFMHALLRQKVIHVFHSANRNKGGLEIDVFPTHKNVDIDESLSLQPRTATQKDNVYPELNNKWRAMLPLTILRQYTNMQNDSEGSHLCCTAGASRRFLGLSSFRFVVNLKSDT